MPHPRKQVSARFAGSLTGTDSKRRARLHLTGAVAGLFGTAGWSLVVHQDDSSSRRWWSLASLIGFSVVAALARALRQSSKPRLSFDATCTVLVAAIITGWVYQSGSSAAWLAPLPPLLVLVHWASGGPRLGALALAAAVVVHVSTLSVDKALAGIPACFVAVWLGREISNRGPKRRRPAESHGSPRAHVAAGDVIDGKYRILKRIGKGGMGTVYEARRISDEGPVAVKILHPQLAAFGEPIARFRREVEATTRLPERRVARIFEVGSGGRGVEYVAMELLQGEDLAAKLRRVRRLSCDDTVHVVEQLAEVLEAAAECGIVHRDVKPRNIFLTEQPSGALDVRLLDFGICWLQDPRDDAKLTRAGRVLGTPGFLSPEQISGGFGELGPHTDVFAVGCVAYQCLSGQRPFPAREPAEAVYEVLNHSPPSIRKLAPELPAAIEWVLAIALAKQVSERYLRAAEFARDLSAAAARNAGPELAERGLALLSRSASVSPTVTR